MFRMRFYPIEYIWNNHFHFFNSKLQTSTSRGYSNLIFPGIILSTLFFYINSSPNINLELGFYGIPILDDTSLKSFSIIRASPPN